MNGVHRIGYFEQDVHILYMPEMAQDCIFLLLSWGSHFLELTFGNRSFLNSTRPLLTIRNERLGGWPKTQHLEGILNATIFGVIATQGKPIFSLDYKCHCELQGSFG